jgi:hypothetical protein
MKYGLAFGGVMLIALALWLGITRYGAAEYARGRDSLAAEVNAASITARNEAIAEYQRGVADGQMASAAFIQWREGPLRTLRETINHETIVYRDSPAGAAVCLDADGVRDTNQSIAAINASAFPASPGGGIATLPTGGTDHRGDGRDGEPGRSPFSDRDIGIQPRGVRAQTPVAGVSMAQNVSPENERTE